MNGAGFTVLSASVAAAASPSSLDIAGAPTSLTFGGSLTAAVPAGGAAVVSDAVTMPVTSGKTVEVTVTASAGDAPTRSLTPEPASCTDGALAGAATAAGSAFGTVSHTHWLSGIQVNGPKQESLLVLGTSITASSYQAGFGPYRWTDLLMPSGISVANDGVGGSEISQSGLYGSVDGITRLKVLLREPYATWLVIEQGTNDLAAGVSSDTLLAALSQAASMGTAQTLNTVVATLSPRQGIAGWTAAMEAARVQVNTTLTTGTWASSRGVKILDLDKLLQDPANPSVLNPAYDSGDHLHPNASGDHVIAVAVAQMMGLSGVT